MSLSNLNWAELGPILAFVGLVVGVRILLHILGIPT